MNESDAFKVNTDWRLLQWRDRLLHIVNRFGGSEIGPTNSVLLPRGMDPVRRIHSAIGCDINSHHSSNC